MPSRRARALTLLAFTLVGCKPGVREDRTITFGPDGRVSFQHGRNGVFVTDPATGKPKQIYTPTPGDVAASPPAWDAAGERMVFAVARALDGTRPPTGDAPADGHRIPDVPARYTCWLYDPANGGEPQKLFEAECGSAGAVGAGLAVGWHTDGGRVHFVERVGQHGHRVMAFDLTTRRAEPVPLPQAEQIALGVRSAVLGGTSEDAGVWVLDEGGWWRVLDSTPASFGVVELGRMRPRWSRDGKKLAFVAGDALRVCDTTTLVTRTWYRSEHGPTRTVPIRPPHLSEWLHWHPDSTHIGVIDGTRLGLVGPKGWERTLSDSPVLAFAGWDSAGRRTAYVALEPLPYPADVPPIKLREADGEAVTLPPALVSGLWAPLFVPNHPARSAVWLADADGNAPRKVVSDIRATFPHWSPNERRLSVWLTVEPPYRLAPDFGFGMRPGDPAAVIDADTGKLDWLPVNGTEHAQIGHVELRRGNVAEALRRFDEAAAGLPPDARADWIFFRAVALRKAGREADAAEAMRRFAPPPPRERNPALGLVAGNDPRLRVPQGEVVLTRHRFAAEAFVSLDMANEGIEFLRREFAEAQSDGERFSASVALGQLLALAGRRAEFAEHVADVFLPLALRVLANGGGDRDAIRLAAAGMLAPLAVPEFHTPLPDGLIRRVYEKAQLLPAADDGTDFAVQLFLLTAARRLGDAEAARRATARLDIHPTRSQWVFDADDDRRLALAVLFDIRLRFQLWDLFQQALVEGFAR